jgi:hypothetical protein
MIAINSSAGIVIEVTFSANANDEGCRGAEPLMAELSFPFASLIIFSGTGRSVLRIVSPFIPGGLDGS